MTDKQELIDLCNRVIKAYESDMICETSELDIYRIALNALRTEPCYWKIEGHLFSTREEALYRGNRGTPEPLYEEPPSASLLEKDIGEIIHLLENFTWAEHCTKTELGSRLEAEITRLHDELSAPPAASAVPNITTLVTRAYNTGYKAGHNDTVESRYIDIHRNDIDSYHSEEVSELIEDAAPLQDEGE